MSHKFPSPVGIRNQLIDAQNILTRMISLSVMSGIAALPSDAAAASNHLLMTVEALSQADSSKMDQTFQEEQTLKKSASSVISALRQ